MNNAFALFTLMPLGIFVIGVLRIRSWKDPVILVVYIFLLAFLVEINGFTKIGNNETQIVLSNLFAFLYVLFVLTYYSLILNSRQKLNLLTVILFVLSIALLIVFTFIIDHIKQYPLYAWQVGNLIIIILSSWMLVVEAKDLNSRMWRKSLYWIALANIVFAAGSILDFSIRFYSLRLQNPFVIFQVLYIQGLIINTISYSLILKGVWEAGRKT